MRELIDWMVNAFESLGYPGIFLMMAMEGSVFPVPSELVIPRAGYLAFTLYTLLGSGLWVTILAGIGFWIGNGCLGINRWQSKTRRGV